jgi:hypothetical protein
VLRLTPSEHLSQNEIDAANLVRFESSTRRRSRASTWPAHFTVARAYVDQLVLTRLATELDGVTGSGDPRRVELLTGTLRELAAGR